MDFLNWLQVDPTLALSLLSSILSILITFVSALRYRSETRRKLAAAKEAEFKAVMASNSLEQLGQYMDEVIGQFLIIEYASDPTVQKRVDSFVKRIQGFVGTVDEIPPAPSEPKHPGGVDTIHDEYLPQDLVPVLQAIRVGQVWNGLALMRRILEEHLRQFARRREVELPSRAGAGRMVQVLASREALDPDTAASLRFAIDIANRAVHGEEVSMEAAETAVRQAVFALERLNRIAGGQSA
jgi:hypothetical protein